MEYRRGVWNVWCFPDGADHDLKQKQKNERLHPQVVYLGPVMTMRKQ